MADVLRQVGWTGDTPPMPILECPKCGAHSGDSWGQCGGKCPVADSPYFDGATAARYSEQQRPELPDVGCCYQHVKTGRFYIVTGVKLGTLDQTAWVVYDPLYQADLPEGHTGFVQSLPRFMDGRFRRTRQ